MRDAPGNGQRKKVTPWLDGLLNLRSDAVSGARRPRSGDAIDGRKLPLPTVSKVDGKRDKRSRVNEFGNIPCHRQTQAAPRGNQKQASVNGEGTEAANYRLPVPSGYRR
jgi:hypothetical protein